jgi:hypothetical protein
MLIKNQLYIGKNFFRAFFTDIPMREKDFPKKVPLEHIILRLGCTTQNSFF